MHGSASFPGAAPPVRRNHIIPAANATPGARCRFMNSCGHGQASGRKRERSSFDPACLICPICAAQPSRPRGLCGIIIRKIKAMDVGMKLPYRSRQKGAWSFLTAGRFVLRENYSIQHNKWNEKAAGANRTAAFCIALLQRTSRNSASSIIPSEDIPSLPALRKKEKDSLFRDRINAAWYFFRFGKISADIFPT